MRLEPGEMFGLPAVAVDRIRSVFARHPAVRTAILYGSRAKGIHRAGSDIDLTIDGDLSLSELLAIETELDELLLPYGIDLSLLHRIDDRELLEHIRRVGVLFFERK